MIRKKQEKSVGVHGSSVRTVRQAIFILKYQPLS